MKSLSDLLQRNGRRNHKRFTDIELPLYELPDYLERVAVPPDY